jgi:hypothetical protein
MALSEFDLKDVEDVVLGLDLHNPSETEARQARAIRNVLAELERLQELERDPRVRLVMMVGEKKPLAELTFDVALGEDLGFAKVGWFQWGTVIGEKSVYPHIDGDWPEVAREALDVIEAGGFQEEGKADGARLRGQQVTEEKPDGDH